MNRVQLYGYSRDRLDELLDDFDDDDEYMIRRNQDPDLKAKKELKRKEKIREMELKRKEQMIQILQTNDKQNKHIRFEDIDEDVGCGGLADDAFKRVTIPRARPTSSSAPIVDLSVKPAPPKDVKYYSGRTFSMAGKKAIIEMFDTGIYNQTVFNLLIDQMKGQSSNAKTQDILHAVCAYFLSFGNSDADHFNHFESQVAKLRSKLSGSDQTRLNNLLNNDETNDINEITEYVRGKPAGVKWQFLLKKFFDDTSDSGLSEYLTDLGTLTLERFKGLNPVEKPDGYVRKRSRRSKKRRVRTRSRSRRKKRSGRSKRRRS